MEQYEVWRLSWCKEKAMNRVSYPSWMEFNCTPDDGKRLREQVANLRRNGYDVLVEKIMTVREDRTEQFIEGGE